MEYLAAERAEVLVLTFGVGTLDPGHAPGVVPASQEALHRRADPLQAEPTEAGGVVGLVPGSEIRKLDTE